MAVNPALAIVSMCFSIVLNDQHQQWRIVPSSIVFFLESICALKCVTPNIVNSINVAMIFFIDIKSNAPFMECQYYYIN